MRKFVFRLETLLRHRQSIEEEERAKFSRIRGEMQVEINRRETLADSRERTRQELAGIRQCDSQDFLFCCRFLDYLGVEIKRCEERITEIQKRLAAQKEVMVAATRDRKIIENLKAKKQREYQVLLQREEQNFVDEIVVTRFATRPEQH